MSDKKRQRRGAFSPPEDPFDLAPLPVSPAEHERAPSPSPPPEPARKALPDPIEDEDVSDGPTEPTPGPITTREGGLRVQTLKVAVSRPRSSTESSGLAGLIEVNTAGEAAHYEPPPIADDKVSIYDDDNRAALLDQDTDEVPPTEESDPLPTGSPVVVHDRVQPTNFSDTHQKDATVFKDDEVPPPPKPVPLPHAWWERSTAGSSPSPSTGDRLSWASPHEPLEDPPSERGFGFDQAGAIALVAALVLVALYAYVHRSPAAPPPANEVELASPVVENLKNLRDEAEQVEQETAPELEEPEPVEEAVAIVETPVEPEALPVEEVPDPDEEASEETETVEAVPPPEVIDEQPELERPPEVIEATEELEDQARDAIYDVGILVVESTSQPALVYVDDEAIGHTPIEGIELEPGTHRIKAVVPGRTPKTQSVRIDPGGAHLVSFSF